MTWARIFQVWDQVECDLQDVGVDLTDPAVGHGRTWRWAATRVLGLLSRPPLGYLRVYADDGKTYRNVPLYATRLQTALLGDRTA